MQWLREWRRRAFGAAIGAVVAPAAILGAALAVGLGGGGLGALGALGQALDGPQLPESALLPRPGDTRGTGRLLAQVRDAGAAAGPAAAGGPSAAGPTSGATNDGGTVPTGTDFDPGAGNAPPTDPAGTPPPPVATTVPDTPPPVATESPARQVADSVRTVTDQLPVIGAPAGELVGGVADTVDTLLP